CARSGLRPYYCAMDYW
nr:immunoglobulin heavy chain junction region [Mus musculus]